MGLSLKNIGCKRDKYPPGLVYDRAPIDTLQWF